MNCFSRAYCVGAPDAAWVQHNRGSPEAVVLSDTRHPRLIALDTGLIQTTPGAMTVHPSHDYNTNGARCFVNLVSVSTVSSKLPLDYLLTDFKVRHFSPQDVIHQSLFEQERMMVGAIATLVDWDEMCPVVLLTLKEVARQRAVPLVVLCGPDQDEHVAALVVGGDDILLHPVNPIMLRARLRAYRRLVNTRPEPTEATGDGLPVAELPGVKPSIPQEHDVYTVGPLKLDRTARRFYVKGHLVELSAKAYDLVAFLMSRVGECHSRDAILSEVWGIDFDTETNILDVQVYRLRSRLKSYGLGDIIETVRGVGYRLIDPQ